MYIGKLKFERKSYQKMPLSKEELEQKIRELRGADKASVLKFLDSYLVGADMSEKVKQTFVTLLMSKKPHPKTVELCKKIQGA